MAGYSNSISCYSHIDQNSNQHKGKGTGMTSALVDFNIMLVIWYRKMNEKRATGCLLLQLKI